MKSLIVELPSREQSCLRSRPGCIQLEKVLHAKLLGEYISSELVVAEPVAAIIRDAVNFDNPLASIPNKRVREKSKQVRKSLSFREFTPADHIEELFSINHSRFVRSGGRMRGWYLLDREELCDYFKDQSNDFCNEHHNEIWVGAFTLSGKLVGYAQLKRIYNFAYLSRFLVHHDAQPIGASHGLLSWSVEKSFLKFNSTNFLFYGHWFSGGEGLQRFKRYHGFKQCILSTKS